MRRISDDECRVMGFDPKYAHPAWMVLTVLPVPPPAVRPSVAVDSNARCGFQQACAFDAFALLRAKLQASLSCSTSFATA